MKPLKEITCPECKNKFSSRAKGATNCKKCGAKVHVNKSNSRLIEEEKPGVAAIKRASGPTVIRVQHIQEEKRTELPTPKDEPRGVTQGVPDQPGDTEASVAAAPVVTEMIPPVGLYSIFVELPNNFEILIFPELAGELKLSEEEEKAMMQWATMLYDYCVRHGITIPDYLELLPIILIPVGFHIKRVKLILRKVKEEKASRVPVEPEIPTGTIISEAGPRNMEVGRIDEAELARRMAHTVKKGKLGEDSKKMEIAVSA